MKRFILIVFIHVFCFIPVFLKGQVNVQDSLALVDLYNSTDGANWTTKTNWLSSAKLKDWYGVSVSGGRVKWLYLQSNNLTGNLPSSFTDLTAVSKVYFTNNNLTGNIPQNIGNLTALTDLNFYNNDFSGEIPASIGNLAALTDLNFYNNDLSGEIPESIGTLTAINEFNVGFNNLSGSIPASIGNLINLEKLYFAENNLSGNIPVEIGNLTALTSLIIFGNSLTGSIPVEIGNLTELENLNLQHNELTDEIPNEIGNLTSLTNLDLGGNNLTGSIPDAIGNLVVLRDLNLFENNFTGEIPSTIGNLLELQTLLLNNNNLTENIPTSIKNLPKLYWLDLKDNQFLFSGLEQFAPLNLTYFFYTPQDSILLEKNTVNNIIELTMDAGGTQTTYQWYYNDIELTDETNNKCAVLPQNEIGNYHCEAKNSLLPDLTLYGKYSAPKKKCWEVGQLKFCLNSGTWNETSDLNMITTTNTISINDFLFFNGTMTIDTVLFEVAANGEFYVDNIPLPGGGTGKYSLMEGEYNLTLMGNEGRIMDFLNSSLSSTALLFGTPMKIEDLEFIKRNDTIGVKVSSSVSILLLSAGCGGIPEINEVNTELAIKDLAITNKGILSAGFQVDNLGFLSQGCLKNATLQYDWEKDILIGGAEVSVSYFGDVGGGVKIEDGKIDSVAWKLDSNLPPIPIYLTLGVKGFYGHFAGLNNVDQFNQQNLNKLDIKIGGIFTDFVTDNFYLAEVDGRIKLDGLLETNGSLKLLQPPGDVLPYQFSGTGGMKFDYSGKQLDFDFNGKFGTLDEETWLADAWGGFSVNYHNEEPEASSRFSADITLPKLSDKWPFNWMNSFVTFPVTLGSRNHIFSDNPDFVHGIMFFNPEGVTLFNCNYIIDITKNWYQSGYIQFPTDSRIYIEIEEKSGLLSENVTKTFIVPENNEFGVIEIRSQTEVPVTSITSPSGTVYTGSSSANNIFYTESGDKKEAFWSLLEPVPGDWEITLEDPALDDSVITHFQLKEKEFQFSVNQTGTVINVVWDVAQVEQGQTVKILLDNDTVDFNGFTVAEGEATDGNLNFTLDETTSNCRYYLYLQLYDEQRVIEVYADDIINNPLASLAPPESFAFEYDDQTGVFDFTWESSLSDEVTGYVLSVIDENGVDSVYAVIDRDIESISLFIENFEVKYPKIESYNQNLEIGCPATLPGLITAVNDKESIKEPTEMLKVYPNPTNGNCTIRYFISEPSKCEIMVYDISGRRIAHPFTGFQVAGFHQVNFEYNDIPNGIYLIKFINNKESFTVKSIFNK